MRQAGRPCASQSRMETRPPLPDRLQWLARAARVRLFWEAYAPVFATAALALAVFLALSLIGAWEVLGDPLRLLALLATLGLLGRAAWRARAVRVPTRSDALRRLERTAGLAHRPLDTLQDTAVLAPELWPAHARRAAEDARSIRRVGRTPALSPADPYWLRVAAPVLLVLAVVLAWGFGAERLRLSLSPSWLPFTNPQSVTFEAWIDPPDYTGRPPTYAQGSRQLEAPEGSVVVVRASGARTLPRPRWRGEGGGYLDLRRLGERSVEARHELDDSGTLDWRIGWRREAWSVRAVADAAPTLEVTEPPEADKQDRLVVSFGASDDYGVERVVLDMAELRDGADAADIEPDTRFDTQTGAFRETDNRTLKLDLTRHPLAGRKVVGWLVAIDGAGNEGRSEPLYFTVPDKIFVEPLAKAIVEQRGLIVAGLADGAAYAPRPPGEPDDDAADGTFDTYQSAWRLDRAPAPIRRATALIEAVTLFPDPGVYGDPVVYVGLRHVGKSLRYARGADALTGLPEHMWKLALRAEFGTLGTALQEMQEAEAALREGIARRAPQREIDTLFERYNQAVDNYMEELRRNAEVAEGGSEGGGSPLGSTDEIAKLLKAIEEANARGDTEGARQALAQLAELLENMQIQLTQGGGGGEGDPSQEISEEMAENLEDLAESLADQRELEDETRRAQRDAAREGRRDGENEGGETPDGQPGEGPSAQELAERQAGIESFVEGLQQRLEDGGAPLPREGGEAQGGGQEEGEGEAGGAGEPAPDGRPGAGGDADPDGQPGRGGTGGQFADNAQGGSGDALERAQEAMRRSREALEAGDLAGARQAQREAVDALREAGDALSREAMAQRAGGSDGEGDPLGRSADGFATDTNEADIDPRDNAARSREIQDELRRRASEAEREAQEREYLERLLDRF